MVYKMYLCAPVNTKSFPVPPETGEGRGEMKEGRKRERRKDQKGRRWKGTKAEGRDRRERGK
jgi:hypothetical protein